MGVSVGDEAKKHNDPVRDKAERRNYPPGGLVAHEKKPPSLPDADGSGSDPGVSDSEAYKIRHEIE